VISDVRVRDSEETSVVDLPFEDRADFQDVDRGLGGALDPCLVRDASGRVVWDNDAFAFLQTDCLPNRHPVTAGWPSGVIVGHRARLPRR
jgi:alkyl sulfatase BDS1-like metallo-beta-lactamase superfamily hydrolase